MDPLHVTTFALHSNPGTYALLVGSGLSSSVGVPTGYAVMLDLVRQLAHLRGEPCEPTPETWYEHTFSRPPIYSEVVAAISDLPAVRRSVLQPFFEPTDEEKAQGLKVPGAAHRAIARLVELGHVRVIVTTNFDRLIERALEEAGIAPVTASTDDQVAGLAPLAHQRALVIKINGDYLDDGIRNSPSELASYERETKRVLRQVFDEYGLIVCGWSATHDVGLRHIMERSSSRRYGTIWIEPGTPSREATQLVRRREAILVSQPGERFLSDLADSLEAFKRFHQSDVVSEQVTLARAKRFLCDPRSDVELEVLLASEARRVAAATARMAGIAGSQDAGQIREYVLTCDGITLLLRSLLFTIGYFGEPRHVGLMLRTLRTAAPAPPETQYADWTTTLRDYPGLLLYYALGMGAVATGRDEVYFALLCAGKPPRQKDASEFVERWHAELVPNRSRLINQSVLTGVEAPRRSVVPFSAHVYRVVQELATAYVSEAQAREAFDRWDMLVALFRAHCQQLHGRDRGISVGLYGFRGNLIQRVRQELTDLGSDWPPLARGLFSGGDSARVLTLLDQVQAAVDRAHADSFSP